LTLELFLCSLYLAKIAIFLDYAKTILAFRNTFGTSRVNKYLHNK
jgi:hypothetical protein